MASATRFCPRRFACSTRLASRPSYVHADIGWECWIKEGNALPRAHHRSAAPRTRSACSAPSLRSPRKRRKPNSSPALRGKGYQYFSPIVSMRQKFQSRHLHAALPVVPRQSAELHSQEARRRLRGAEGRCRGLPPEHRRTLCRRGVDQSAAGRTRRAAHALEVQAVRERCRRRPCDFGAHHHASRGAPHLRSGIPACAQVRLQVGDNLREAQRAA